MLHTDLIFRSQTAECRPKFDQKVELKLQMGVWSFELNSSAAKNGKNSESEQRIREAWPQESQCAATKRRSIETCETQRLEDHYGHELTIFATFSSYYEHCLTILVSSRHVQTIFQRLGTKITTRIR
jgi:hypothetical protein